MASPKDIVTDELLEPQPLDNVLTEISLEENDGAFIIVDSTDDLSVRVVSESVPAQNTEEAKGMAYRQTEEERTQEDERTLERELREKKRRIDMEGREIEEKLREVRRKLNAEEEKKKEAAELLRYRRYPENQALAILRALEKQYAEEKRALAQ